MALCVIYFFISFIYSKGNMDTYSLFRLGAVASTAIQSGQLWRLLTGTFLHANLIHLLVNIYSLCVIGMQLENFLGKRKFFLIYITSAISGSLMSSLFNPLSVGASGAIFGLLGSILYFGYHYRLYLGTTLKTQIIPIILLNLFMGFMLSNIDNAAHIGGLIGGYLATMALGIPGKSSKTDEMNGYIVLVIYIAFLSIMLFR